jgi:rhodanese-related sulfurtransferase
MQGETQRISAFLIVLLFQVVLTVMAGHVEARSPVVEGAEVHDFGMVKTGDELRHSFQVRNRTRHPLKILSATGASSSFHILSYPEKIPSGEIGQVEVRWIPSEPGEARHAVLLQTEREGEGRTLRFLVRGTATSGSTEADSPLLCSEIPPDWLTRVLRRPDPTLLISIEWLKRQLGDGHSFHVVDVRSPEKHDSSTIPGAIQVPLFSLASKEFLKSRPLVLVGEGIEYSRLEPACGKLRECGFTAWILEGGVRSWKAMGLPVEGGGVEPRSFPTLSPREFFEERHLEHWVLVSACRSGKQEMSCLIPQAISLPHPERPRELTAQLKTLLGNNSKNTDKYILMIDDDGTGYAAVSRELEESGLQHVYFLDGGIMGYRIFIEQQAALARADKRMEKRMGAGCPNCPEQP